jgi:hypothetical protein
MVFVFSSWGFFVIFVAFVVDLSFFVPRGAGLGLGG